MGCTSCQQTKPQYTNNAYNSQADGTCGIYGCMEADAIEVKDFPVDQFETAPDYFMTIRTKQDKTDGSVVYQPMLTPGAAVVPLQNMANRRVLPTNNTSLTVEPGQVLPAYVENNGSATVIHAADEAHPAQFLVLQITDGNAVCQNTGWVDMPVGHKYVIGANYYRSNKEGELTTDPSQTGQYLFTPVGRFTLALEIKRGI